MMDLNYYISKEKFISILKYILLISLLFGIIFWAQIQFNLFKPYALLIFLTVAALIIIKPRTGFFAFVFAGIISESHYLYGYELFHSIYTFKIFAFTLIDWLLFILIARTILLIFMQGRTQWKINFWDIGFCVITAVIILASITGLLFHSGIKRWLVDIKALLFFVVPYIAARFYLNKTKYVVFCCELVLVLVMSKTIVYLTAYFIKSLLYDDLVIVVTLTSDVVFYPLLLLVCITLFILTKDRFIRTIFALLGFFTLLSTFWCFGRETWFWTAFSFLAFFMTSSFFVRKKVAKILVITTLIFAGFITVVRPSTWEYAVLSVKTFTLKATGRGEEETGAVRIIEWINIHNLLVDTHTLLTGRGMGSTWTDRYYPLPKKRDIYSFPVTETEHVFTHMAFSKFYLKFGLLGSLLFWSALVFPWIKTFLWTGLLDLNMKHFMRALLMGSIGIIAKLELIRVAFVGGILFGIFACLYIFYQQQSREHSKAS